MLSSCLAQGRWKALSDIWKWDLTSCQSLTSGSSCLLAQVQFTWHWSNPKCVQFFLVLITILSHSISRVQNAWMLMVFIVHNKHQFHHQQGLFSLWRLPKTENMSMALNMGGSYFTPFTVHVSISLFNKAGWHKAENPETFRPSSTLQLEEYVFIWITFGRTLTHQLDNYMSVTFKCFCIKFVLYVIIWHFKIRWLISNLKVIHIVMIRLGSVYSVQPFALMFL